MYPFVSIFILAPDEGKYCLKEFWDILLKYQVVDKPFIFQATSHGHTLNQQCNISRTIHIIVAVNCHLNSPWHAPVWSRLSVGRSSVMLYPTELKGIINPAGFKGIIFLVSSLFPHRDNAEWVFLNTKGYKEMIS